MFDLDYFKMDYGAIGGETSFWKEYLIFVGIVLTPFVFIIVGYCL